MRTNTKSSVTLPREELRVVEALRKRLKLRTKVEVVRRGLRLLKETTDRAALQAAYRAASEAVREDTLVELADADHLAGEGLE